MSCGGGIFVRQGGGDAEASATSAACDSPEATIIGHPALHNKTLKSKINLHKSKLSTF